MNVAVTVWKNRISPVFDTAQDLLVTHTEGTEIVDAVIRRFQASLFNQFINLLETYDVHVLICGALCKEPALRLKDHGITVFSFVTGETEHVLEGFLQGKDMSEFAMPGCRGNKCCRTETVK